MEAVSAAFTFDQWLKLADTGGLMVFSVGVALVLREQAKTLAQMNKALAVLLDRVKGGRDGLS